MTGSSSNPRWLVQAAEEHPRRVDPRYREEDPAEVLPGDVCVVGPYNRSDPASHRPGSVGHLCVVIDVAGDHGWFTGMLAGTATELATEVDAILGPECSGLGYELAVHSRYFGPLWTVQVRRRIGAIEESVVRQLDDLSRRDEPIDVELRRGLPLQPDGIEPRYAALRALSEELDDLTDHCRRRRHDLGAPVLDPAIGSAVVLDALLAETGWQERVAPARPPTALLDCLRNAFPSLTMDQQHAAMPLLEAAVLARPQTRVCDISEADLVDHMDPGALAGAIAESDESVPVTRVLSHPRCWSGWSEGTPSTNSLCRRSGSRTIVALPSSDKTLREAA